MIYVTIGNEESYGFRRLIEAMDAIAADIDEQVVFQIAKTPYEPKNGKHYQYLTYAESLRHFEEARLIVSHCSTGAIINARKFGKPLVVVPRRRLYGELFDEHQMELAQVIEKEGNVRVVYDTQCLKEEVLAILRQKVLGVLPPPARPEGIIKAIQTFMKAVEYGKRPR